jgi:hypothetical protein
LILIVFCPHKTNLPISSEESSSLCHGELGFLHFGTTQNTVFVKLAQGFVRVAQPFPSLAVPLHPVITIKQQVVWK